MQQNLLPRIYWMHPINVIRWRSSIENPLMQEMKKKSVERTRNRWKLIVVFLMLNTTSNNVLYPSSFIRIIQVLCVSLNIATSAIVCSNKYIFLPSYTHKLCKNNIHAVEEELIDKKRAREFYSFCCCPRNDGEKLLKVIMFPFPFKQQSQISSIII